MCRVPRPRAVGGDCQVPLVAEERAGLGSVSKEPEGDLMEIGMVGLGRMGADMTRRLLADGHRVIGYDINPEVAAGLTEEGMEATADLEALVDSLQPPRIVWVMLPAAVTGSVVDQLTGLVVSGDVIVDGGNSYYRQAVDTAARLADKGIGFVDVGTSGGVHGLERGYCLMIGGETEVVERLDPIFRSLAPGVNAAPRSPRRSGEPVPEEYGYLHCGPPGAGHFVKMAHNGIEYGLMAAYAEGLNILAHAGIGTVPRDDDAETAPLLAGGYYTYEFELDRIAEVWRRGSVIGSWLLDLIAPTLAEDPTLAEFGGNVADSGEGRWTILTAVEEGVPAPVLSAALFGRFDSRGRDDFANQVLSAMRYGFGGHEETA